MTDNAKSPAPEEQLPEAVLAELRQRYGSAPAVPDEVTASILADARQYLAEWSGGHASHPRPDTASPDAASSNTASPNTAEHQIRADQPRGSQLPTDQQHLADQQHLTGTRQALARQRDRSQHAASSSQLPRHPAGRRRYGWILASVSSMATALLLFLMLRTQPPETSDFAALRTDHTAFHTQAPAAPAPGVPTTGQPMAGRALVRSNAVGGDGPPIVRFGRQEPSLAEAVALEPTPPSVSLRMSLPDSVQQQQRTLPDAALYENTARALTALADVDGSGHIDILDVFQTARYIAADVTPDHKQDVNLDGLLNHQDLDLLAAAALSFRALPAGTPGLLQRSAGSPDTAAAPGELSDLNHLAASGQPVQLPAADAPTADSQLSLKTLDVFVDSGDQPLAAWQLEVHAPATELTLIHVAGGTHPAFQQRPYYYVDAGPLHGRRIQLAAWSVDRNLPVGRSRVARLQVQLPQTATPVWSPELTAAAASDGRRIPAEVSIVPVAAAETDR